MSQVDLLNRLLPSIPALNEILTKIREKYLIPEILPEDEQLAERKEPSQIKALFSLSQ